MAKRESLKKLAAAASGKEEEQKQEQPDYDKPEVQSAIMNPDGFEVELSYGKIRLYKFSLENEIRATGFTSGILADSFGAGARSQTELGLRVAAVLLRNKPNRDELLTLVSYATAKPGVMDDIKAAPIKAEIESRATANDYVELFGKISELCNAPKT